MAYGVIYCLTDGINNKKYVGQTVDLKRRIEQHKRDNLYVDKAIRKHGWENCKIEVLEECENREQLNEREIFWIAELKSKSPNGYNLTDGGNCDYNFCEEIIMKLTVAGTGRKHTEESKRKMSEIAKKVWAERTPEERYLIAKKRENNRSPEEKSATARKRELSKSPEERSTRAKKCAAKRTPEERSAIVKKAWVSRKAKKNYHIQIINILNQIISKKFLEEIL